MIEGISLPAPAAIYMGKKWSCQGTVISIIPTTYGRSPHEAYVSWAVSNHVFRLVYEVNKGRLALVRLFSRREKGEKLISHGRFELG